MWNYSGSRLMNDWLDVWLREKESSMMTQFSGLCPAKIGHIGGIGVAEMGDELNFGNIKFEVSLCPAVVTVTSKERDFAKTMMLALLFPSKFGVSNAVILNRHRGDIKADLELSIKNSTRCIVKK